MKVKICGMRSPDNIKEIITLKPEYLGFIFYSKSPRFIGKNPDPDLFRLIPGSTQKVAVFVNETPSTILKLCAQHHFEFVQIHGDESSDYCAQLKANGLKIIKAFGVDSNFDFHKLRHYSSHCDFFLFDTKGIQYGGNGFSFNWNLLQGYSNELPFFLSGGIDLKKLSESTKLKGLNIEAMDLNSKFEIRPGIKDPNLIRKGIELIHQIKN